MKKSFLKYTVIVAIALVAFLGVNFSQKKSNVSGEQATATLVSLGSKAMAYCNEAMFAGEYNNGWCDLAANDPNSRCHLSTQIFVCTTSHGF